jgi:Rod binding domain-containing protein
MVATPATPGLPASAAQPSAGAGAKPAADDKTQAARAAAEQFEALFLAQMMTHMFAGTSDPNGMFGGGPGEEAFRDMLTQEYAKVMAKSGGVGIADSVMREMLRQQETK